MKQHWKGSVLLSPLPAALVSCGDPGVGKINVLTVAWCGILCTHPALTYVSVRPERYSYGMIRDSGEFVINLPTSDMAKTVDFCGMYTGAKVDKFERCGLTPEPSEKVAAPSIAQCPVSLECRLFTPPGVSENPLRLGTHDMFIAEIVSVGVDPSLIDRSGKLRLERAGLLAYSHGDYQPLAGRVGFFGFSAVKNARSPKGKNPKGE